MTTAHSSMAVSALNAAFESGNENLLVEELRKISSQKSRREGRIALVARILEQTGSPRVRNAAALALADMRAQNTADKIIRVLRREDTKGYRGTLLYALEQLDAILPISLLVALIIDDSYETREEALPFITNEKFDWDEDPGRIRRRLLAALPSAGEEQSHAINAALESLASDRSLFQKEHDLRKEERKQMTENTIILSLLPAPDDPRLSAHEYQNDLHEFYHSLQKASVGVSARMRFRDAIGAEASLLGTFFIPLAKVAIPTLGVVLVAWLKGRSGRRVRLECDGVMAEGGTLEEVETLLKHAAEFRDSQQKSDGDT